MDNILTLNQGVFKNNTSERRLSKRARRAMVKKLYTPVSSDVISYDDGDSIDGGAALQIVGVAGVLVSMACTAILWMNDYFDWGINFFWRMVLKITRVVGDVAAIIGGIGSLAKGTMFNVTAKVLAKIGFKKVSANAIAIGLKTFSTAKNLGAIFA